MMKCLPMYEEIRSKDILEGTQGQAAKLVSDLGQAQSLLI